MGAIVNRHRSLEHDYLTCNIISNSDIMTPEDLVRQAISDFVASGNTYLGGFINFLKNYCDSVPEYMIENMTRESRKRCEDEFLKQINEHPEMEPFQVDIHENFHGGISTIAIREV